MKKFIALLIAVSAGIALGISPAFISFNAGQVSKFIEARSEYAKYLSSCRTLENMFVLTHGPIERRPGTEYIGQIPGEINVYPYSYKTTATSSTGSKVTALDEDYAVLWQSNIDTYGLGIDISLNNYIACAQSIAYDTSIEPVIIFDEEGTDQGIDFEYSDANGDFITTTSGDVQWSSDGAYVYNFQTDSTNGTHISKYSVATGTRIWRTDLTQYQDLSHACVKDDNYLYIPHANSVAPLYGVPSRIDLSTGSQTKFWDYSVPEMTPHVYGSCISESLGYIYWAGQRQDSDAWGNQHWAIVAYSLTDSSSYITWDADDNLDVCYDIVTDDDYIYAYVQGDIIKFDSSLTEITRVDENVNYHSMIINWEANLAVCLGNKMRIRSREDLSIIEDISTLPYTLQGGGINDAQQDICAFPTCVEYNPKAWSVTIDANNNSTRIIPFEYSTDDSYVLMLGDNYMGFYRTDSTGSSGQILE